MISLKSAIIRCRNIELQEQDSFKKTCYFINYWSIAQSIKEYLTEQEENSKWAVVNECMKNYFLALNIDKQGLLTRRRLELLDLRITLNKDVVETIDFLEKALPENSSFSSFYNMDMRKKRGCFAVVLPEYNFF